MGWCILLISSDCENSRVGVHRPAQWGYSPYPMDTVPMLVSNFYFRQSLLFPAVGPPSRVDAAHTAMPTPPVGRATRWGQLRWPVM